MLTFKEKIKLQRQFNKQNKSFSRAETKARQIMTKAGIRYKYQKVISNMIVDFFFPKRLLVLEIDGPKHDQEKDSRRDAYIRSIGFNTLRFSNNQILTESTDLASEINAFPAKKVNLKKNKEILKSVGSWMNGEIFKNLRV